MTREERQKVVADTTERVLDEVEAFLVEQDRSLWDGERLNIQRCMALYREMMATKP
jgi:hypothetical protein